MKLSNNLLYLLLLYSVLDKSGKITPYTGIAIAVGIMLFSSCCNNASNNNCGCNNSNNSCGCNNGGRSVNGGGCGCNGGCNCASGTANANCGCNTGSCGCANNAFAGNGFIGLNSIF